MDSRSDTSRSQLYRPVHRIGRACRHCRLKKARCSGQLPCSNCQKHGYECEYEHATKSSKVNSEDLVKSMKAMEQRLSNMEDALASVHRLVEQIGSQLSNQQPDSYSHGAVSKTPVLGADALTTIDSTTAFRTDAIPLDVLSNSIDVYFENCHNQPYSFFHEATFRTAFLDNQLPHHLLLAIVANAARFSRHAFFERNKHETARRFADLSWRAIMSDCFTAPCNTIDVYTVQTTTLLAIFDFTAGKSRHGQAWIKIGMAIRIAQDLQMTSEHDATAHPSQKEQFRRSFWSLYLLDRLCSCGRYRPSAILDASCHLRLPAHEEAWRSGQEEQTSTLSKVNTEPCVLSDGALSPFANVIIMGGALAKAAQYMLQDMDARAHHPPWDVNSDFTSIQSDLVHLETQLQVRRPLADTVNPSSSADNTVDQAAVAHDIYARILFHLCNCLLNHPFLLRRRLEIVKCAGPSSFLHRCFELAWSHAQQLSVLISEAQEAGCTVHASFYCYAASVATTIIALRRQQPGGSPLLFETEPLLQLNLRYLETMGEHWEFVAPMTSTLHCLINDSPNLNALSSDDAVVGALTPEQVDLFWTLLDYSAMCKYSRGAPQDDDVSQVSSQDQFTSWDSFFDPMGLGADDLTMLNSTIDDVMMGIPLS